MELYAVTVVQELSYYLDLAEETEPKLQLLSGSERWKAKEEYLHYRRQIMIELWRGDTIIQSSRTWRVFADTMMIAIGSYLLLVVATAFQSQHIVDISHMRPFATNSVSVGFTFASLIISILYAFAGLSSYGDWIYPSNYLNPYLHTSMTKYRTYIKDTSQLASTLGGEKKEKVDSAVDDVSANPGTEAPLPCTVDAGSTQGVLPLPLPPHVLRQTEEASTPAGQSLNDGVTSTSEESTPEATTRASPSTVTHRKKQAPAV